MKGLTVLSLLGRQFNSKLGKKGAEGDITHYSYKSGGLSVELIEPTLYPEKINPLVFGLGISDFVLFRPNLESKEFGEILASLMIAEIPGTIVGDVGLVEQYTKGTCMSEWRAIDEDPIKIRELLASAANSWSGDNVKVIIDQVFNLKSVGVVVLGSVSKGTVSVHDELSIFPGGQKVFVKSLQLNDENVQQITNGSRLGASIKGVAAEEIARGSILGSGMASGNTFNAEISCPAFIKGGLAKGKKIFAYVGFQYAEGSLSEDVSPGDKKTVTLRCSKDFAYEPGDDVYIVDPGMKPRILAKGRIR